MLVRLWFRRSGKVASETPNTICCMASTRTVSQRRTSPIRNSGRQRTRPGVPPRASFAQRVAASGTVDDDAGAVTPARLNSGSTAPARPVNDAALTAAASAPLLALSMSQPPVRASGPRARQPRRHRSLLDGWSARSEKVDHGFDLPYYKNGSVGKLCNYRQSAPRATYPHDLPTRPAARADHQRDLCLPWCWWRFLSRNS